MIQTEKNEYEFKKVDGTVIQDVADYINKVMIDKPGSELYIGADSKVHRKNTLFIIIIAIRYPGKGAHIIYCAKKGKKHHRGDMEQRLWKEVEYVVDLGLYLSNVISRKITLHIDISPHKEHESNALYNAAMGWMAGIAIPDRIDYAGKPDSWAAMRAADALTRKL